MMCSSVSQQPKERAVVCVLGRVIMINFRYIVVLLCYCCWSCVSLYFSEEKSLSFNSSRKSLTQSVEHVELKKNGVNYQFFLTEKNTCDADPISNSMNFLLLAENTFFMSDMEEMNKKIKL